MPTSENVEDNANLGALPKDLGIMLAGMTWSKAFKLIP